MNFQNRLVLALVLCTIVWVAWTTIFPPPPPPEPDAAGQTEVVEATEAAEAAEAAPERVRPELPEPAAVSDVPIAEHRLQTGLLGLSVTNRAPSDGGIVSGIELRADRFAGHDTAENAFGLGGAPTLSFSFADERTDFRIPATAAYTVSEASPTHVALSYASDEVEVEGRIEVLEGYEGRLRVRVTNRSSAPQRHRLHVRTRLGLTADESRYDLHEGICRTDEDVETEDKGDVEDGPVAYDGPVLWGGVETKYFATLVVPEVPAASCDISLGEGGGFLVGHLAQDVAELAPGETRDYLFGLYIGAKELEKLGAFSAVALRAGDLQEAIDWGILGGLSEALGRFMLRLLRWFHEIVDSWGLAIVCLTILIKLLTLPLTLKQMSSMKRMKEIQPEIEKIKKKYADDKVKQSQEMQALFSRSGANPLAGCLPMLVQLPIYFALYGMLGTAVELVHESFLWLPDLTKQDQFYVLPVAIGVVMVFQNRMMPSTGNEAQARMMRWIMPIMFAGFMLFLPSGLSVYIFVNVLLSVVQTAVQVGFKDKVATPTPKAE